MSTTVITPGGDMMPAPGSPLLTAAEFMDRYPNGQVALVKGVVKELPVSTFSHGEINLRIGRDIGNFVESHGLGRTADNDSRIRFARNPDTVYGPDFSFISYARLPKGKTPTGVLDIVPDLIVEVRSEYDRWIDITAKVVEYLRAGVTVVVVADPQTRTVSVYRDDFNQQILTAEQTLTLPDVLPGWSVPVARWIE